MAAELASEIVATARAAHQHAESQRRFKIVKMTDMDQEDSDAEGILLSLLRQGWKIIKEFNAPVPFIAREMGAGKGIKTSPSHILCFVMVKVP